MTQQSRNENARVVCLFCGARTFVPASATRDSAHQPESGLGDCAHSLPRLLQRGALFHERNLCAPGSPAATAMLGLAPPGSKMTELAG